jgi:transcriptional regulator with XRE-family HTH domain
MITGEQIKAGRALLRWTAKELSDRSGVSVPTIQRIEATRGEPSAMYDTIERVRGAMETAGLRFYTVALEGRWWIGLRVDVGAERPTTRGGGTLGDTQN